MLILNIRSGMGDTLQSWSDAWDFHCQHNVDVKFVWEKNHRKCQDFQYYFSGIDYIDVVNIDCVPEDENIVPIDVLFDRFGDRGQEAKKDMVNYCTAEKALSQNILYRSACSFINFQDTVRKRCLLPDIKPSKNMEQKMDEYCSQVKFVKPVGLHIRRTDNKRCIEDSPDSLFERKIEDILKKNPEQMFFLCTDDNDVRRKFLNKYGDRIFSRNVKERYSDGGLEDGVVDLFLLSKCRAIYGCQSGFAKLAAAIGGIELHMLKLADKNRKM